MKLRQLVLLLPCLLLLPAVTSQAASVIAADRVVAVVNNEVVTQYDLNSRLALAEQQLRAQKIQLPAQDVLARQVLEQLVMDRIQLQFAKESGTSIGESELESSIARIAESNSISVSEMRTSIERDGMSWEHFRQDIREQFTLSRLRERVIENTVQVSDGEIDNYLANPPPADAGGVSVAHILVRAPEQATPEQLAGRRSRAEQAYMQIKAGEDFGKVAATFSDAPDALTGGVLATRPLDRLPTLFAEAVAKMNPGDVSDVLRSPAGFHIVKLVAREEAKQGLPALKQTHARHILIKINEITSESDARRKMISVKERLDNGSDFAELARLYSEDGSASKGGDLGWLYEGDTVPEFERTMNDLKVGEVSRIVQSQFGLHLIQVLERRVDEGSKERQRMVARAAIRERKADEAFQDWLRQQRDSAYVEYRLEDK